jgi:Tn3 transposase DDE domain
LNRLGEIRDRSFENQRYRASGLDLVIAAIILWNTVYLERAVQSIREADGGIRREPVARHFASATASRAISASDRNRSSLRTGAY